MTTDAFNDLVKRRGSVAAELDHGPPNWTGADEASFRYGADAKGVKGATAADLKPEEGYRWVLDENGGLRYDRMKTNLPPRQFNTATRMFEDATEAGLIRAEKGVEEAKDLASLPKSRQDAMKAAFKNRAKYIAKRDQLRGLLKAGEEDTEEIRKIGAQINEQSRLFGENAAEGVMKQPGGAKIYPLSKAYSTSGDFDQVWKVGDEFHLVEAKGGSSGLGSRALKNGTRAEQGTKEYAMSIAENMAVNGKTPEIRKLGREMGVAIGKNKFKYILVRAPIAEDFSDTAVMVSEFVLK